MISFESEKEQLIAKCQNLLQLLQKTKSNVSYEAQLTNLLHDLQADKHIVTVLGEFKRGKSSLINALLQEEILPADVTPTTATINIIRNSEARLLRIHYEDGSEEVKPLDAEFLQRFNYDGNFENNTIHHLDIQVPFPNFDEKVVLIDTPGVGDLNEHRLDVTYSYIPRSNVILFLFDASTPIRKTELDYLEHTVLKLKFGEIIFVANFIDRLDEDELEETLDYMEKRLTKYIEGEKITIVPLSSRDALSDATNPEYVHLIQVMNDKLHSGEAIQKKIQFYENRFADIVFTMKQDAERMEQIHQASLQDLEQAQAQLEKFNEDKEQYICTFKKYIEDRTNEIIALTTKSIEFYEKLLIMKVTQNIEENDGKLQKYIEKSLPSFVKNEVQAWINIYTPKIDTLLQKLELEISNGFRSLFNRKLDSLRMNHFETKIYETSSIAFSPLPSKSLDSSIKSGVIAGGAGVVMAFLGAGMLVPLITLAGLPFLNNILHEKQNEKIREVAIPYIQDEIKSVMNKVKDASVSYIQSEIALIGKKSLLRFDEYIIDLQRSYEDEITSRQMKIVNKSSYFNVDDVMLIAGK